MTEYIISGGRKLHYYCVYSLRATVGTLLTWAKFNANSIDYLQGHAPNNTTARFYLNHEANPKAATEAMVNYLAHKVIQQPLGKVGLSYAMSDYKEEQRLMQENKAIDETIRYGKEGISLLSLILAEKAEMEKKQQEEMMNELVAKHGEDLAEFLKEH